MKHGKLQASNNTTVLKVPRVFKSIWYRNGTAQIFGLNIPGEL